MRTIPVDTAPATLLCATAPKPKIKDLATGEVATDRETGASLYTLGIVFLAGGQGEIIAVTVPEPGLGKGINQGAQLSVNALVAIPWENVRDGQMKHGIAFRAAAVTVRG